MKRYASHNLHRLYVLVSMLALMGIALSARWHAENRAPEWDTPFHQNAPDGGEDNAESEDHDADDEQDSAIVETGFSPQPLSSSRQNLLVDVPAHSVHHVKITIPPPKHHLS